MRTSLAERMRVIRARLGLSLKDASERTGVDRHTLRQLELGGREPRYPTLHKIAEGYGVDVEELLPASEETAPARKDEASETTRTTTRTIMGEADLDKWAEEEPWAREQIEALRSSIKALGEDEGIQFSVRVTFSPATKRSSASTPWPTNLAPEG